MYIYIYLTVYSLYIRFILLLIIIIVVYITFFIAENFSNINYGVLKFLVINDNAFEA